MPVKAPASSNRPRRGRSSSSHLSGKLLAFLFVLAAGIGASLYGVTVSTQSSVNVVTYHNDNARTGQNLNESVLRTKVLRPETH